MRGLFATTRCLSMRVHILARAPVAGRCKTRLIPHLGARGAAWVQRRLLEHVLDTAIAAVGAAQVTLWGAPDAAHSFFAHCRRRYDIRLARQRGGDLGARMRHALGRRAGLLVGSDAFGLQADDLRRAAARLAEVDHLLLPAGDGGYVLIGTRKGLPSLAGVQWSSGREYRQTRQRLERNGSLVCLGPARGDFDGPGDWRRARRAGLLKPLIRR